MAPVNTSNPPAPGPVITAVLSFLIVLSTIIACSVLRCGSYCSRHLTRTMIRLSTWPGATVSLRRLRKRQRRSRQDRSPFAVALLPLPMNPRRHRERPSTTSPATQGAVNGDGETLLPPPAPMPTRGPGSTASAVRAEAPPSYSVVRHHDSFIHSLDGLTPLEDIPHLQLPPPAYPAHTYSLGSFRNGWFVVDPPSPSEAAISPGESDFSPSEVAVAMIGVDLDV